LFYQKNIDIIKYLIDKGIDVNQVNIDGNNAIFYQRDPHIIEFLIDAGINVNQVNNKGNGILFYDEKNPRIIRLLLSRVLPRSITHINNKGNNVLFYHRDSPEIIKLLLDEMPQNSVNQVNKKGNNALFYHFKNVSIIRYLIKAGINVNQINNKGYGVLFYHSEAVQLLINAGAKINSNIFKSVKARDSFIDDKMNKIEVICESALDFSATHINKAYPYKFLDILLKYGLNINQIHSNIYPRYLKDKGHDAYLPHLDDSELKAINIINLLQHKTKNWRALYILYCRRFPELLPIADILKRKNVEEICILMYNSIYPSINITAVGEYRLDSLGAIKLFIKISYLSRNTNESDLLSFNDGNITLGYLPSFNDGYNNFRFFPIFNDNELDFFNKKLAFLFVKQLYFHPIIQNRLIFKEITSNVDTYSKQLYIYYRENAKKLFSYLSTAEILLALDVTLTDIYRYRLRTNYRDNRSLRELLNNHSVKDLFGSSYDPNYLWNLLFETTN
jgi:ankyrin repeat protein